MTTIFAESQLGKRIRAVRTLAKWMLLAFALLVALYLIIAQICQWLPRNREFANNGEIVIWVLDNGVHTDLLLPVVNDARDWRTVFTTASVRAAPKQMQWLSIGWGDAEFYLNTPSWSDLRVGTALRALTGANATLLHIGYHPALQLQATPQSVALHLTSQQYQKLIASIDRSIVQPTQALPQAYADNDAFFAARGHYGLFRTCNTWTGDVLREAGVTMGAWTPFAWNVMRAIAGLDQPAPLKTQAAFLEEH